MKLRAGLLGFGSLFVTPLTRRLEVVVEAPVTFQARERDGMGVRLSGINRSVLEDFEDKRIHPDVLVETRETSEPARGLW